MGKNFSVLKEFRPLLLQLVLLVLPWYFLWQTETGQHSLASIIKNNYLRVIVLFVTIVYAIVTSCVAYWLRKKNQTKNRQEGEPSQQISLVKLLSDLTGYLVFSIVWVAVFKAAAVQATGDFDRWTNEPYRFYILIFITVVFFFVFEQLAQTLRIFIDERYKSRLASIAEKNIRREIFVVSYLLLSLLLLLTNGLIQNFWLLQFSIILLQMLFPFLMNFCPQSNTFNLDESNYKNWLGKEMNKRSS